VDLGSTLPNYIWLYICSSAGGPCTRVPVMFQ
jgi:hypothetical protein